MKKYKNEEVVKKIKVLSRVICDECGKDIDIENSSYYEVVTSDSLWGNDSVDSTENLEFCSFSCLNEDMTKYFEGSKDTYKYEIERIGDD